MAIKRLILHLGISKTGSSSIQYALYNNSLLLEENGFHYLTEWGDNHIFMLNYLFSPIPVKHMSNFFFFGEYIPEKKRQKINKKYLETMIKVINSTKCDTLIISGEYHWDLYSDSTIEKMKDFLNTYFKSNGIEVFIILLIRNPLNWIISSFQQDLSAGMYQRNIDYFDNKIMQYQGITNLKKHFSDSLILLKYEDAIIYKDGLIGFFLKNIGFPESNIKKLSNIIVNESRCFEVMEFINYIEDIEPIAYLGYGGPINPNRYIDPKRFLNVNMNTGDLQPILDIKGSKFDFTFQEKLALWERLKETIQILKMTTGIDYTDYQVPIIHRQKTYSDETIQSFIDAFPKLSPALQKLFLKFFGKKYSETLNSKFKKLYFEGSYPWKIFSLYEETKKLSDEKLMLISENTKLAEETRALSSENTRLAEETRALSNENTRLTEETRALSSENTRLTEETRALSSENTSLEYELMHFYEENEKLFDILEKQSEEIDDIKKDNLKLGMSFQQILFEREDFFNSRSWRITKPLRGLKKLFKYLIVKKFNRFK